MPGMMYIPRRQSPWEQMLPQMLGQMALMKIQQNYQAKQAEIQREHELTLGEQEKRYDIFLKTQEAERKFGEKAAEVGGRRYIMTPGGLVYAKEPSKAVTSKTAPKGTQQIISPEGRKYMIPPPVPVTVGGQTIGYQRGTKFIKAGPESVTNVNIGKPASAEERKKIAETRASLGALQNLKDLFDSAYVGPLAGRMGAVKDLFGFNISQQSAFYAAEASLKNEIIKLITGAQMSEVEAKRIMKEIPDRNDPPSVWKAKWEQTVKNKQRLEEEYLKVLEQSGLKAPKNITLSTPEAEAEKYLQGF